MMGEASAAVKMASGWPLAMRQARAAKTALAAVQTVKNVNQSMSRLVETTAANTAIMTSGNAHGRKRRTTEGVGNSSRRDESIESGVPLISLLHR